MNRTDAAGQFARQNGQAARAARVRVAAADHHRHGAGRLRALHCAEEQHDERRTREFGSDRSATARSAGNTRGAQSKRSGIANDAQMAREPRGHSVTRAARTHP